jgi:hypothetical protein
VQQTIPLPPNQPFDPELVRSMSLAYGNVCRALGLSTKPDSATEVVALKIMEIVEQRRATTPTAIYLLAIEELRDGK